MMFVPAVLLLSVVSAWIEPGPGHPGLSEFVPPVPMRTVSLAPGFGPVVDPVKKFREEMAQNGITFEITSDYTDAPEFGGIRHVYFRQTVPNDEGPNVAVTNGVGNMNVKPDGTVLSSFHRFTANLDKVPALLPLRDAAKYLQSFASKKLFTPTDEVVQVNDVRGEHDLSYMIDPHVSIEPIGMDRRYVLECDDSLISDRLNRHCKLKPVFQIDIQTNDNHWYDVTVDVNGDLTSVHDRIHKFANAWAGSIRTLIDKRSESFAPQYKYNVYPMGTPDPHHGGRKILNEPSDPKYAPVGWHKDGKNGKAYRSTMGNNVRAQENLSGRGHWRTADRPDSNEEGAFDFKIDLKNGQPLSYLNASITNLFFHNNIMHDVFYAAGFDEVSGNFQESNFGRGGREGDPVIANCQDGSGMNNANFATPPDGQMPMMRMYTWDDWTPDRDGDLDAGIIYHEYTHGIGQRLTGGPAQVNCLVGPQPGGMGEGWGDFTHIMFQTRPEHNRMGTVGTGHYVVKADTIRKWIYSSNMTLAPQTYSYIKREPIHEIGTVWASILYEVYWNLIDEHDFDTDWYKGSGGNNRMIRYVVAGMKLQPCYPKFIDARDAILEAAKMESKSDYCLMWEGFARRGLGEKATGNPFDDFSLPLDCEDMVQKYQKSSKDTGRKDYKFRPNVRKAWVE